MQSMYRAGWGQSVRTEHHLAHPKGPRGGASTEIELARVGVFVADLLLPVPRRHALGELIAVTTGVSGSVGDGGSSPVTSFQPAFSNRWAAMVVTAPITPT